MGYWRRIKSSFELPEPLLEVIPFNGAAKIKNTYPIVTINEINHTLSGYQVVTSNGAPIAFYDINNSDTFGLDLSKVPYTHNWPEQAVSFIILSFCCSKWALVLCPR